MSVATLGNRTVTVQRATITTDAWGSPVKTWAANVRTRARVQPLTGERRLAHLREGTDVTHMAYFAGTPDIIAGDRFVNPANTDKYLHVQYVANTDLADRFLACECEERDD